MAKETGTKIASSTASAIGTGMKTAGKLAIGGAIGAMAGGAVGLAKAIGIAAEMEDFETQFETLLGSAGAAKQRLQELEKFGATTPFNLSEVVQASKILQTMTGDAMATGKGLRLVGDVASGTGANFSELAVTIGRMYDGLRSGRPVGEAMARLQEIGAISGEVRGKIEAMAEAGDFTGAWKAAESGLMRFSGLMDKQSKNWRGMMSNLGDAFDGIFRAIGTPVMEALKPALQAIVDTVGGMKDKAAQFGEYLANGIKIGLELFKQGKLASWLGDQLIVQLANVGNFAMTMIQGLVSFLGNVLISGAVGPALKLISYSMAGWGAAFGSSIIQGIGPVFEKLLSKIADGLEWMGFDDAARSMKPVFKGGSVSGYKEAAQDMDQVAYGMMSKIPEQVGLLTKALGEAVTQTKLNLVPSTAFNGVGDPARARADSAWFGAEKSIKQKSTTPEGWAPWAVEAMKKENKDSTEIQKRIETNISGLLESTKELLGAVTGRVATN